MIRFKRPRFFSRPRHQTTASERRLRLMLLLFLACVAVPLYVLFNRVYSQLRQEALYQYRLGAEHAVQLVDDELTRLMTQEANRPFADYGFFRVEAQKLLQTKDLALSPLSQFPVSSQIPGLIGYFQISPEGILSSPVLPDITQAQFEAYRIEFSEDEYASRLALKDRLEQILKTNRLSIRTTPGKRRDISVKAEQHTPAVTTALSSQESLSPPPIAQAVGHAREEAELESDAASAKSGVDLHSTFRGTKLTELNIDKRLYRQQQSRSLDSDRLSLSDAPVGNRLKSELKRQRKERIDIPENQSIEAYREFLKSKNRPQNEADDQAARPSQPRAQNLVGGGLA